MGWHVSLVIASTAFLLPLCRRLGPNSKLTGSTLSSDVAKGDHDISQASRGLVICIALCVDPVLFYPLFIVVLEALDSDCASVIFLHPSFITLTKSAGLQDRIYLPLKLDILPTSDRKQRE